MGIGINTKYNDYIYSRVKVFLYDNNDNYIITSTFNTSNDNDESATKIYLLNNGNFLNILI